MTTYDYTTWGVGISTLLVVTTFLFLKSRAPKAASAPPKLTFVESVELKLRETESRVRDTVEPGIGAYYETYDTLKDEDKQYKFNFFQEELLKELIKLDGIELSEMADEEQRQALKADRKLVIKYIQSVQKKLDAFKKEHKELE